MRSLLPVTLTAALMSLTGCIIHHDDDDTVINGNNVCVAGDVTSCSCPNGLPGERICNSRGTSWGICECPTGARGDINLNWNFEGRTCSQTTTVHRMKVTITGPNGVEALDNDGNFYCSTQGVDGIRLLDFVPGSYQVVVEALDYANKVHFRGVDTVVVNGSVQVPMKLSWMGVELFWKFGPDQLSCADAGVESVQVTVNGDTPQTLPCEASLKVAALPVGVHTVVVDAWRRDSNDYPQRWFAVATTVETLDGQFDHRYYLELPSVYGQATFMPKIVNQLNQTTTCADSGVQKFWIRLKDLKTDQYLPGLDGFYVDDCEAALTYGIVWDIPVDDVYDTAKRNFSKEYGIEIDGVSYLSNPAGESLYKGSGIVRLESIADKTTRQVFEINTRLAVRR